MPPDKDPYQILGLQPGATQSEIKKAYHNAGRKHHPDHNEHPDSTQRMQDINYAYEILSDPEKRKQYDQTNQKPDFNQGYCASCSGGKCTHGFNFKPARPIPKQVCHWCRDGNMLFQTDLCPQHLWCSRCFILRYTLACSDARCCEQMITHAEVKWRLPAPVAALYDMKRACDFEPLRRPKLYDDLCRAVRDRQEANPSMAYGLAASYALMEKREEINKLQEQLADCNKTNKELRKQLDDLQSELERKQKQLARERDTRAQNKSSAAADGNKLAEKDEKIRVLQADLADCFNNKDRFKPGDHNSFSRKQLGSKLSELQWRHDNTQKDSTRKSNKIKELETQITRTQSEHSAEMDEIQKTLAKAQEELVEAHADFGRKCKDNQNLKAESRNLKEHNPTSTKIESDLKDQLTVMRLEKIKLENTCRILRGGNERNLATFSAAQKESSAKIQILEQELKALKDTKNEKMKAQPADLTAKPHQGKVPQAYVGLEASLARAQAELKSQRSTIQRLEEELKTAKAAAEPVPAQAESNLEDELIRKNMRIAELERSLKIAKDANAKNIQAFSEAQKARNVAVDSEAVVRKENERLTAELAAALSGVEQLRQDSARTSTGARDQSAPSVKNIATEKRNKDLEAELAKVELDLQTQQQALTDIEAKYQAKLSAAQADMKTATDKEDVAKQELENTKAQLAKAQEEKAFAQTSSGFLKHRTSMLEKKPHHDGNGQGSETKNGTSHQAEGPSAVTPPQIKIPLLERLKAAQRKVPEQSGPPSSSTPFKASPPSSAHQTAPNMSSPCAPVTPTPAPRDATRPLTAAVASPASIAQPTTPSKSPLVTTNAPANVPASDTAKDTLSGVDPTEHQASQKGATKFQTRPFDLAASKPSFDFSFSKANKVVNTEGPKPVLPAKMTEDKTVPQPPSQTEQPTSRASKTNEKPKTPTSLLKGQIHYAKATQKAAQEDARRATEEISKLRAELKRYKQFEFDAYHEIARANEMYGSLERKLAKAKNQPRQREERSEGAIKIPADQFAHPVDDDNKSASELLARLNKDFAPMKAEIKKSLAARKKIETEEESSLKISARTNRRLRDTIRQKDLEIEDMRINYGNRWASLLGNVCAKESEIRRLKKKLHVRESRSSSQASTGAVNPPSLGEKGTETVTAEESNEILRTSKSSRKIDRTIENYRKNKKEREIRYQKIRADRSKFGASCQRIEHLHNQPEYVMIDTLGYSKVVAEFLRFDTALTKEIERLSKQPRYARKVKTRTARPRVNFNTILQKNDGQKIGGSKNPKRTTPT
ncbi:hypothetical protein KCU74_g8346, partial [Aureobasidium melanogenum]